jgi:hypothetical protein
MDRLAGRDVESLAVAIRYHRTHTSNLRKCCFFTSIGIADIVPFSVFFKKNNNTQTTTMEPPGPELTP